MILNRKKQKQEMIMPQIPEYGEAIGDMFDVTKLYVNVDDNDELLNKNLTLSILSEDILTNKLLKFVSEESKVMLLVDDMMRMKDEPIYTTTTITAANGEQIQVQEFTGKFQTSKEVTEEANKMKRLFLRVMNTYLIGSRAAGGRTNEAIRTTIINGGHPQIQPQIQEPEKKGLFSRG